LSSGSGKLIGIPDGLIEERNETSLETLGAITSHDLAGVRNVALHILAGLVDTIPATREHKLETDTIFAIGIEISLVWQEVTVQRTLGSLGVVEAVESKSGLAEESLGVVWSLVPVGLWNIWYRVREVALVGVTSNHLKSLWECGNIGLASIGVKEVVSGVVVSELVVSETNKHFLVN
jgi:hypothetical protein